MTIGRQQILVSVALALSIAGRAMAQCEAFHASGSAAGCEAGYSVSTYGNRLVYSDGANIRVMRWMGVKWVYEATITLPNTVRQVVIHGDAIAVGTAALTSITYIYRFQGSTWELEATINLGDHITAWGGRSIDLQDNVLVISDASEGIWIFRWDGSEWNQEYTLEGEGISAVATGGARVIYGIPQFYGEGFGRAWILHFNGVAWYVEAVPTVSPVDTIAGHHVDISGNVALIGVGGGVVVYRYVDCGFGDLWCEEVSFSLVSNFAVHEGTITLVDQNDDIIVRQDGPTHWPIVDVLSASDLDGDGYFGHALAMDANSIVAGAPLNNDTGEDSGTIRGFRRGVVYVDGGHTSTENGACVWPFNTFQEGVNAVGSDGLLVIAAGVYSNAPITISVPMSMTAAGGTVRID